MMIIDFIASYGGWSWVVAGLVFLALELALPGGILVWMGIAGILTGIVELRYPLSWPLQWLLFGTLSLVSILVWTQGIRKRNTEPDRVNNRMAQLVGTEAVLDTAIGSQPGRIAVGDTVWLVTGEHLPAGTRVRVTGADGAVLRVVPVAPS